MVDTLTPEKTEVKCVQNYAVLGKRMPDQNVSCTQNLRTSKTSNINKSTFYYFKLLHLVFVQNINTFIHI